MPSCCIMPLETMPGCCIMPRESLLIPPSTILRRGALSRRSYRAGLVAAGR
jgi:hypothetical protein